MSSYTQMDSDSTIHIQHISSHTNAVGEITATSHTTILVTAAAASPVASVPNLQTISSSIRWSSLWVLTLCTLLYFLCQLHRWSLGVVSKPLEADLRFGDGSGSGLDFQLIAGPVFITLFSTGGLFVTLKGGHWNRTWVLATNMFLCAITSVFVGLSRNYTELALARAGQGLAEAGAGGFCASMIAQEFSGASRGTAMAVYNFGIYSGYGAAFALAPLFHPGENEGWRWMFHVFAMPCVVLGILFIFTIKDRAYEERKRKATMSLDDSNASDSSTALLLSNDNGPSTSASSSEVAIDGTLNFAAVSVSDDPTSPIASSSPSPAPPDASSSSSTAVAHTKVTLFESFRLLLTTPALLVLCLASSFRTGAGVIWGFNTEQFYENVRGLTPDQISAWMSWTPIVFGTAGAILGGVISDWLLRRHGPKYRIGLLVVGQLLAAPCAVAALLLGDPYSFLMYSLYLLIAETYIGTCYAVLMDLTPTRFHSFIVAVYIFCMANGGGNMNLLLPPVQTLFNNSMLSALIVLWPGFVALSGLLYAGLFYWAEHATFDSKLSIP